MESSKRRDDKGVAPRRLSLLSEAERAQVLCEFNATAAPYPHDRLIHEIFEEQARNAPRAVAVMAGEERLTYADLNQRANQLAWYLIAQGLQPGGYVPIVMGRGLRMLIAKLAVLKGGGAYVPVDPGLPQVRQAFVFEDCGARLILSEGVSAAAVAETTAVDETLRWVDCAADEPAIRQSPVQDPQLVRRLPAPAYVMYTSGSTGTPKGVVVTHHGVNRLVINNGYADIRAADCVAYASNPAFDASTFEIWSALLNGARVAILPPAQVLEPQSLAQAIRHYGITILFLTTALFNQHAAVSPQIFAGLRYLFFGGEACDARAVRRVLQEGRPQNLLHVYGPTETTTYATWYPVSSMSEDATTVPIGKPIANTTVYILDKHLQPVPIGVSGEIYIGGAGVALGYLNRPELTAERFIQDPFVATPDARLYRSGDLGRWRKDGNIEFLGRNDQQVKIRGFRIEPGEIEARLMRHPVVKEALVIAREDAAGQKQLVAYVTGRDDNRITADDLRAHLKSSLPDYMVPSAFVLMDRLPLTANGKLERQKLPAPGLDAYAKPPFEAPEGQTEEPLARLWRELLQVERVGRADNFFELGGHSLLATQLIAHVRAMLSIDLPMTVIFECPTLRELAAQVEARRQAQLLEALAQGGDSIEELLETVVALPESKVQELMREITTREPS
jgi:amino acid adenylation domain-containing protein